MKPLNKPIHRVEVEQWLMFVPAAPEITVLSLLWTEAIPSFVTLIK